MNETGKDEQKRRAKAVAAFLLASALSLAVVGVIATPAPQMAYAQENDPKLCLLTNSESLPFFICEPTEESCKNLQQQLGTGKCVTEDKAEKEQEKSQR